MKPEQAQVIALNIMTFLISEPDRAAALMHNTGMDAQDLRHAASNLQALAGVVDYLLSNDQLVVAFATDYGCKPESIMAVRRALPGGQFDF
jgi:hypothetical protein